MGQVCYDSSFDCVPGVLQRMGKYVAADALTFVEGCNGVTYTSTAGFADAQKAAQAADYVVRMMGIDHSIEGESKGRTKLWVTRVLVS